MFPPSSFHLCYSVGDPSDTPAGTAAALEEARHQSGGGLRPGVPTQGSLRALLGFKPRLRLAFKDVLPSSPQP